MICFIFKLLFDSLPGAEQRSVSSHTIKGFR